MSGGNEDLVGKASSDSLAAKGNDAQQEHGRGAPGLSITTNLAASSSDASYKTVAFAEQEYQRRARFKERKRFGLDDEYWLRENEKNEVIRKDREFEKRNGFPRSWHLWELDRIHYRQRGEKSFSAILSPHMLKLEAKQFFPIGSGRGDRKEICSYSWKSRKKFYESLLTIDWENIPSDTIREAVLTYPSLYPKDGLIIKEQLHSMVKRLNRFASGYGDISIIWKLEFQRRGAPHYHLVLVTGKEVPIKLFREWLSKAWNEIVSDWLREKGSLTEEEFKEMKEKHLKAGIELAGVRKNKLGLMTYLALYISKGKCKAKEYQHEVPEEFQNVGRWWGFYGRKKGLLSFVKRGYNLTEEQFYQIVERVLNYWHEQGRSYRTRLERVNLYSFDKEVIEKVGEIKC